MTVTLNESFKTIFWRMFLLGYQALFMGINFTVNSFFHDGIDMELRCCELLESTV